MPALRNRLALAAALAVAWPALALAAETYKVDPSHSSVVFKVKHMNTSNAYGRFNDIAGTFTLDEANPANCRFEFTVKADSIDTANAKRDEHLKGSDFFNVRQFPTIAFRSTSTAKAGDKYRVGGDLSLHGVTKPVEVTIEPIGRGKNPRSGAGIAGIEAVFVVKRSDFGMSYGLPDAVGDEVTLIVSLEGSE